MSSSNSALSDKHEYLLEIVAAILLGLATVFGAFSAYQSALYGGQCLTKYNQGVALINEANTEYLQANQEIMMDMIVWMEWTKNALMADQDRNPEDSPYGLVAAVIDETLIYGGLAEAMEWADAENENLPEDEWLRTPFDSEAYTEALYADAGVIWEEGNNLLIEGQGDNSKGDHFTLVTVFFAIVLFLGGMASLVKRRNIKITFAVVAVLMFVYSVIQMFAVPFTS